MKRILICPAERPGVAYLAQWSPLVNVPILGECLMHWWMESLAAAGVRDVLILATDRPEQVREKVAAGTRWGIRACVQAELQEPTAAAAQVKCAADGWECPVLIMDHLPGLAECSLFNSYCHWFAALQTWILHSAQTNRIGFHELTAGIWVGRRTQIASSSRLIAPCWIGQSVRVGPHAVIGPRTILEDKVVIEPAVEVSDSIVGPETFVGKLTRIQNSIACGNTLIDWPSGSCAHVPDAFLLGPLRQRSTCGTAHGGVSWTDVGQVVWMRARQLLTGKAKG